MVLRSWEAAQLLSLLYPGDSANWRVISLKKLLPCGIVPPKFSAMVCPISAKVSRTPRFTPAPPPGAYTTIVTYSRDWSVVYHRGSGSHPWSAVLLTMSEGRSEDNDSA